MKCFILFSLFVLSCLSYDKNPIPWDKTSIVDHCGDNGDRLVCDLDDVLDEYEVEHLTRLLQKDLGSEGYCQKKINVVIVEKIMHLDGHDRDHTFDVITEFLREQWMGDCYTTVVILLSTEDEKIWGRYGYHAGLTSSVRNQTFYENKHHFEDLDYSEGLEQIIRTFQHHMEKSKSDAPVVKSISALSVMVSLFVIGFVLRA